MDYLGKKNPGRPKVKGKATRVVRIDQDLYDEITERFKKTGIPDTTIVSKLIKIGLAKSNNYIIFGKE